MPVIRDERVIAAGAAVANILAGSVFEFVGQPTAVMIYGVMDGPAVGTVSMDCLFGSTVEAQTLQVPTFTATLGPNRSDHLLVSGIATPGDRLQIRLANGGGANANTRVVVDLRPL